MVARHRTAARKAAWLAANRETVLQQRAVLQAQRNEAHAARRREERKAETIATHEARHAAWLKGEKYVKIPSIAAQHGRRIYVWNHLQTNQIIYSLTEATKNKQALEQIPYNGKKTVPAALRKDHWMPLCQITLPPATTVPVTRKTHMKEVNNPKGKTKNSIGLLAFQKLREYKRRHELEWDPEVLGKDPETGYFVNKQKRGRKICDQKANSVADLAAVLKEVTADLENNEVSIKWANLQDAEFAETWSSNVVHDTLEYRKNNRKKLVANVDDTEPESQVTFEQPVSEGQKLGEDLVVQEKKKKWGFF